MSTGLLADTRGVTLGKFIGGGLEGRFRSFCTEVTAQLGSIAALAAGPGAVFRTGDDGDTDGVADSPDNIAAETVEAVANGATTLGSEGLTGLVATGVEATAAFPIGDGGVAVTFGSPGALVVTVVAVR